MMKPIRRSRLTAPSAPPTAPLTPSADVSVTLPPFCPAMRRPGMRRRIVEVVVHTGRGRKQIGLVEVVA